MSEKFTPGPWAVGYNGGVTGSGACYHDWSDALRQPVVYAGTNEYHAQHPKPVILISAPLKSGANSVVAHVIPEPDSCGGDKNGDANAHLMVSAPDLYAALEAALRDGPGCHCDGAGCSTCRGYAALAAARGEA